jgi:hypothetical protein
VTCPHCGAGDVDRGATGLDLCTRCGGLSRNGQPLARRQPFTDFQPPELRSLAAIYADGVVVAAVLVDGRPGLAVSYRVLGQLLGPFVVVGDQAKDLVDLAAAALAACARAGN